MPATTAVPVDSDAPAPSAVASDTPVGVVSLEPQRLSDRVLAMADRHRRWVFLLILGLYIAGFNAQWRLEPDSALYLAIGQNLVEGKGYTYHGKDHRLAYPGVPLMFAGLFKAFGTASLLPHLVVMWLMGLLVLALVYRLFLLHAGRPTAVLMTFGVAISRIFYRYTFELLTDLPFLLGVMAFFVGYEALFYRRTGTTGVESRAAIPARWLDGVLLFVGLAIAVTSRPSMWALVFAAGLSLAWSLLRGKARWGHIAVAGMVMLAVAVFYLKDPRHQPVDAGAAVSTNYAEEDQLFDLKIEGIVNFAKRASANLPEVLNGAMVKASFGLSVVPGLNAALSIVVLIAGMLLVRTRPLWGMWILATLGIVLVVPKPLDRYFLPTVPILVFAWWSFLRWIEGRFSPKIGRRVFFLLFGLGGACNLASTVGFIYDQRYVPVLSRYKEGRYAAVYDVAEMIKANTPASGSVKDARTTWIVVPDKFARILTFLTQRYCIEPDRYSALDPRVQNVFVLDPTEPLQADPNDQRQATPDWLKDRSAGIDPQPLGTVPSKSKRDPRPWTLHDVLPIEGLATRPATAPAPATQP